MATEKIKEITNVRWEIPKAAMKQILRHKRVMGAMYLDQEKEITNEEAAIDLIMSRNLPKRIILEQ